MSTADPCERARASTVLGVVKADVRLLHITGDRDMRGGYQNLYINDDAMQGRACNTAAVHVKNKFQKVLRRITEAIADPILGGPGVLECATPSAH